MQLKISNTMYIAFKDQNKEIENYPYFTIKTNLWILIRATSNICYEGCVGTH